MGGRFSDPALFRTAALERELEDLRGPGGRAGLSPLPATAAYTARVEELTTDWPNGYLA
ncbi:biliverdin-producing heme oxygenase, partial [Saccharothrix sp. ST-888]|uniref:biliverdin-producing heme oxygenase n=1 Tax=Saccharothrix sp. ST-888 TaxID=1427391 RepID=UPI003FA6C26D